MPPLLTSHSQIFANTILSTNGNGTIQGTTIGGGLSFAGNTLSLAVANNFGNTCEPDKRIS